MHTVSGECHCGILSFKLSTRTAPPHIRGRACDCRFCRIHGAKNWSDPDGSVVIRATNASCLRKYRFALRTADYYLCRSCGAYLGAVLADEEGCWSTVNLRLSDLDADAAPVHYGGEDAASRIARRKRRWTPTTVVISGSAAKTLTGATGAA